MTEFIVFTVACLASALFGAFVASLRWASTRADLEHEVMEQRRRIWNLTRDEHHA